MNKKIVGIIIIVMLLSIGLCGCIDEKPINNEPISEKIIGSWKRADGRVWTFCTNGSYYKEIPDYYNFWGSYEIHNDILTEYSIYYNLISSTIEFESNDKFILTTIEDNSIVVYHRM